MQEIDIEKVLAAKNGKLAERVPRFALDYLKRIVHQDDLNYIIRNYSDLPPLEFISAALGWMQIGWHSVGMERIDTSGRYVFASNHPFGGLDGLMLAHEVASRFGDVRVIVNDLLMNIEPLKPIFIPVNKHGRQSTVGVKAFNSAFESDIPIVTFPAGLCSRRTKGVVADLEWRSNFVKRSIATRRDVVPVYFDGRLSNFFYRLSNLRKRLGVKANIEMLYLVDEMYKQQGSNFEIIVGEPIECSEIEHAGSVREACGMIRKKVYGMKK